MPTLSANGLTLRYRIVGQGPALLLIRGLGRCLEYWLDLVPCLAAHFQVVLMDNRGVGGSSRPRGPWSVADMAQDTAALLRALDLGPVAVFGLSLGGMIAQELAMSHPSLVSRLAIGASSAGGPHAQRPAARRLCGLVGSVALPAEVALRRAAPRLLSPGYLAAHPEIVQRWLAIARRWPASRRGFLWQVGAALRYDASHRLGDLRIPTLVLSGDADQVIPPENSRILAQLIPDARLAWLAGAGHDFGTEAPERTAQLLRERLA